MIERYDSKREVEIMTDEEIDGEELLDLKKIDQAYRDFIIEEDKFMDSRILSAQI